MQAIRIASALHDTTCLLIDNLDFIVVNHILHILIEESVSLQELVDSVHTLSLDSIVSQQGIFLLLLLFGRELLGVDRRELACDVGEHEELRVLRGVGQHGDTLVGELD